MFPDDGEAVTAPTVNEPVVPTVTTPAEDTTKMTTDPATTAVDPATTTDPKTSADPATTVDPADTVTVDPADKTDTTKTVDPDTTTVVADPDTTTAKADSDTATTTTEPEVPVITASWATYNEAKVFFEYYILMRMDPTNNKTLHELHGSFHI